ncbi:hypothetical protein FRC03_000990 [Tulasnella sp. 419]|nr:hypothetical protein FRC03_000990 [Tulasnella sp. 419]
MNVLKTLGWIGTAIHMVVILFMATPVALQWKREIFSYVATTKGAFQAFCVLYFGHVGILTLILVDMVHNPIYRDSSAPGLSSVNTVSIGVDSTRDCLLIGVLSFVFSVAACRLTFNGLLRARTIEELVNLKDSKIESMQQRKREEEEARNETQNKLDKEKEGSQVLKNKLEKERKLFKARQSSNERLLQGKQLEIKKSQAQISELNQELDKCKKNYAQEMDVLNSRVTALESVNKEKAQTLSVLEAAIHRINIVVGMSEDRLSDIEKNITRATNILDNTQNGFR